jgi:3-methyladenine DNA glycosylase/8-oxoguanine DNA glycosylase
MERRQAAASPSAIDSSCDSVPGAAPAPPVVLAPVRVDRRVHTCAVVLEATIEPRRPYSLALSARMKSDATRYFRNGVLTVALSTPEPAVGRIAQRPDGSLDVRLEGGRPKEALETLRFVLAADDDHRPFLDRFRDDPLLGPSVRRLAGLRPLRVATVSHALLKAVCGQLIQSRAARLLERRLLWLAATTHEDLRLPPDRTTFAGYAPAELVRHGLAARKAGVLVRISREWDLERLRTIPSDAAATRIERERGLGPWSAGMICLYGLGRFDRGLVGDLGLIKLCSSLRGRRAEVEDTRELLAPYGDWSGLASVYLLSGGFSSPALRREGRTPGSASSPPRTPRALPARRR